jgi:hypothetical protein
MDAKRVMNEQRDILKLDFESQAEWRRQKATEYQNDKRNLEAAEIFDRLAATVLSIPEDVFAAYLELFEAPDGDEGEKHSEMMRSVGFHYWPRIAEEFARDFIANQTGG